MNLILRFDWLPKRERLNYLAPSGLPAVSRKIKFLESLINPLLTKFGRSRWLVIGLVLFCEFINLDSVSVHKHAKNLCQYLSILTSHFVNNPYGMALLIN